MKTAYKKRLLSVATALLVVFSGVFLVLAPGAAAESETTSLAQSVEESESIADSTPDSSQNKGTTSQQGDSTSQAPPVEEADPDPDESNVIAGTTGEGDGGEAPAPAQKESLNSGVASPLFTPVTLGPPATQAELEGTSVNLRFADNGEITSLQLASGATGKGIISGSYSLANRDTGVLFVYKIVATGTNFRIYDDTVNNASTDTTVVEIDDQTLLVSRVITPQEYKEGGESGNAIQLASFLFEFENGVTPDGTPATIEVEWVGNDADGTIAVPGSYYAGNNNTVKLDATAKAENAWKFYAVSHVENGKLNYIFNGDVGDTISLPADLTGYVGTPSYTVSAGPSDDTGTGYANTTALTAQVKLVYGSAYTLPTSGNYTNYFTSQSDDYTLTSVEQVNGENALLLTYTFSGTAPVTSFRATITLKQLTLATAISALDSIAASNQNYWVTAKYVPEGSKATLVGTGVEAPIADAAAGNFALSKTAYYEAGQKDKLDEYMSGVWKWIYNWEYDVTGTASNEFGRLEEDPGEYADRPYITHRPVTGDPHADRIWFGFTIPSNNTGESIDSLILEDSTDSSKVGPVTYDENEMFPIGFATPVAKNSSVSVYGYEVWANAGSGWELVHDGTALTPRGEALYMDPSTKANPQGHPYVQKDVSTGYAIQFRFTNIPVGYREDNMSCPAIMFRANTALENSATVGNAPLQFYNGAYARLETVMASGNTYIAEKNSRNEEGNWLWHTVLYYPKVSPKVEVNKTIQNLSGSDDYITRGDEVRYTITFRLDDKSDYAETVIIKDTFVDALTNSSVHDVKDVEVVIHNNTPSNATPIQLVNQPGTPSSSTGNKTTYTNVVPYYYDGTNNYYNLSWNDMEMAFHFSNGKMYPDDEITISFTIKLADNLAEGSRILNYVNGVAFINNEENGSGGTGNPGSGIVWPTVPDGLNETYIQLPALTANVNLEFYDATGTNKLTGAVRGEDVTVRARGGMVDSAADSTGPIFAFANGSYQNLHFEEGIFGAVRYTINPATGDKTSVETNIPDNQYEVVYFDSNSAKINGANPNLTQSMYAAVVFPGITLAPNEIIEFYFKASIPAATNLDTSTIYVRLLSGRSGAKYATDMLNPASRPWSTTADNASEQIKKALQNHLGAANVGNCYGVRGVATVPLIEYSESLAITKAVVAPAIKQVMQGETVSYRVNIENTSSTTLGTGDIALTHVVDYLPLGQEFDATSLVVRYGNSSLAGVTVSDDEVAGRQRIILRLPANFVLPEGTYISIEYNALVANTAQAIPQGQQSARVYNDVSTYIQPGPVVHSSIEKGNEEAKDVAIWWDGIDDLPAGVIRVWSATSLEYRQDIIRPGIEKVRINPTVTVPDYFTNNGRNGLEWDITLLNGEYARHEIDSYYVVDTLPEGFTYTGMKAGSPAPDFVFTNLAGETVLVWSTEAANPADRLPTLTVDGSFTFTYLTDQKNGIDPGVKTNTAYLIPAKYFSETDIIKGGFVDAASLESVRAFEDTTGVRVDYGNAVADFATMGFYDTVGAVSQISVKNQAGHISTNLPTAVPAKLGETLVYRFEVESTQGSTFKDILIYNNMPRVGDTYTFMGYGRNSAWAPEFEDLANVLDAFTLTLDGAKLDSGYTVYFSDTAYSSIGGWQAATWIPASAWTSAEQPKSFMVDLENETLTSNQKLVVEWVMKAPASSGDDEQDYALNGSYAVNSAAYSLTQASTGQPFVAEPNLCYVKLDVPQPVVQPDQPIDPEKDWDTSSAIGSGDNVQAGDLITYVIKFYNHEASDALVTITDVLDPGVEYHSSSDGGTESGGTVTWQLTLPAKTPGSVTLTVKVTDAAVTKVDNMATVQIGNNTGVDTNTVTNPVPEGPPPTNPEAKKEYADDTEAGANNAEVSVGDKITYVISYTNESTDPQKVVISDDLDNGLTFVSASHGGAVLPNSRTVQWTFASVGAGETVSVRLTARVNRQALVPSEVLNEANLIIDDSVNIKTNRLKNPVDDDYATPQKDWDTGTRAGAGGAEVKVGDEITYVISYQNHEDQPADIIITDPLDSRVSYKSSSDGGVLTKIGSNETVTWTLPNVQPGETGTVTLTVTVKQNAVTEVLNIAYVTVGNNVPMQTNMLRNPISEKPVDPVKDWDTGTEAGANGASVEVGDEITYIIRYYNHESTPAKVVITDTLDTGVDFESATNGGSYNAATRTVTWTLDNVSAHTAGSVKLVVKVNASAVTQVDNFASVTIGGNPAVDTDVITNPVTPPVVVPSSSSSTPSSSSSTPSSSSSTPSSSSSQPAGPSSSSSQAQSSSRPASSTNPGPEPEPDSSISSRVVVPASSASAASASSAPAASSAPVTPASSTPPGGGDDSSTPDVPVIPGEEIDTNTPGGLGEDGRYGSVMESISNNLQALLDGDVPLGNFSIGAAWSLLNLICGLAGVIISVVLTIGTFVHKRKKKDEDEAEKQNTDYASDEDDEQYDPSEEMRKRSKIMKVATIMAGVLTMVLFLILEDIRQPMVWVTRWTPIIVPTFAVHLVLLLLYRLLSRKENEEGDDDEQDENLAPA